MKDEVKSSQDLENVIKKYNGSNWDFRGLHEFFDYHVADEEMDAYFKRLFPCHETLKRFLALIEKVPFVSYIAFHLPKRVSFAFVTLSNFEKKKLILKNLFSSFCRATADGSYDCFFS